MIPEDEGSDTLAAREISSEVKTAKAAQVFFQNLHAKIDLEEEPKKGKLVLDLLTQGLSPYLRDEIKKIEDLSIKKTLPDLQKKQLLLYSNYIAHYLQQPEKPLSTILFLLQQNDLVVADQLDNFLHDLQDHKEKTCHRIENECQVLFENYRKQSTREAHSLLGARLARFISELALLDTGVMNRGIFHELGTKLVKRFIPTLSIQKELLLKIEEIKHNSLLCSIIESGKAPAKEMETSLRLSLGLPPGTQMTDLETKKGLLTSFLSVWRQRSVGNCFAYVFAASRCSQDPATFLFDLKEILEKGSLIGYLGNARVPFTAILTPAECFSDVTLTFDAEGRLLNKKNEPSEKLTQVPGMMEAFQEMGFKTEKEVLNKIDQIFADKKTNLLEVTPSELFRMLGDYTSMTIQQADDAAIFAQVALDLYEANPLLLIWERILADMCAESTKKSTKKKLVDFFKKAFKPVFIEKNLSVEYQNRVVSNLQRIIEAHVHYRYDPSAYDIKRNLKGAFVLFGKDKGHESIVNSFEKFETLFISILDQILTKMPEISKSKQTIKNQILLSMKLNDPQKLRSLWKNFGGSCLEDLLKRYYPTTLSTKKISLNNPSPKDLMAHLLVLSKELDSKKGLFPLEGQGHIFTLWLEQLSPAGKNVDETITGLTTLSGKNSKKAADKPFQERFSKYLSSEVKEELIFNEIKQTIKSLEGFTGTLEAFRKDFFKKLEILAKEKPSSDLSLKIDRCLFAALPQDIRDSIGEVSLHFAKSNWMDRGHDVHFCFFSFPFESESIRIGKIREDGMGLSLLYPHYLLENQEAFLWILPREKEGKNRLHHIDASHQLKING